MFGHDTEDNSDNTSTLPEPANDGTLDSGTTNPHVAAQTFSPTHQATDATYSPATDTSTQTSPHNPATSNDHNIDHLLSIKQDALKELSPLVSHLDQSNEEKFRTMMMMIQASDNQSLIKDAYEAAKSITDEKARAQALLDVVNEINYFTQQHDTK